MGRTFKPGDIVKYTKPQDGEAALTFVVVELRDSRVLIESRDFDGWRFAPQESVELHEVEPVEQC